MFIISGNNWASYLYSKIKPCSCSHTYHVIMHIYKINRRIPYRKIDRKKKIAKPCNNTSFSTEKKKKKTKYKKLK